MTCSVSPGRSLSLSTLLPIVRTQNYALYCSMKKKNHGRFCIQVPERGYFVGRNFYERVSILLRTLQIENLQTNYLTT